MGDDTKSTRDSAAERISRLYGMIVDEAIVADVELECELEKDSGECDGYFVSGVTKLRVALWNAAAALENSGLVSAEAMRCHACGGPVGQCSDEPPEKAQESATPCTSAVPKKHVAPGADKPN